MRATAPSTDPQAPDHLAEVRTPGPPGWRMAWALLTRPNLLEVIEEQSQYGDIARFDILRRSFVALRDPSYLRHVLFENSDNYRKSFQYRLLAVGGMGNGLLTNEGESWARQRQLIQPMFAKRHLGSFAEHMTDAIGDFVAEWELQPEGEEVDVAAASNALTLDVVGRALFGAELAGEAARLRPAVLVGLRSGIVAARLQLVAAAPRWMVDVGAWLIFHLPLLPKGLRRLRDGLNTIGDVVDGLIVARERNPEADPGDLLGLLLAARDAEGNAMSRRQVRDELVTFLLAGHETTANGLAWMWYLLATNRDARDRMLAEVDAVLGSQVPTADDAERLTWTAACFQEALRLRPPVWMMEREAIGEDRIDGHRIPSGATILIPIYIVHHDPRLWPDPERFDPTRFLPDRIHQHPRGAYMPFGGGHRVCIGAGFSILEGTLIAAMIAQHFTLDLEPGARVDPETTITLRPRHGLRMTLHHRDGAGR